MILLIPLNPLKTVSSHLQYGCSPDFGRLRFLRTFPLRARLPRPNRHTLPRPVRPLDPASSPIHGIHRRRGAVAPRGAPRGPGRSRGPRAAPVARAGNGVPTAESVGPQGGESTESARNRETPPVEFEVLHAQVEGSFIHQESTLDQMP